jgi:hypothetical protein
MTGPYTAPMISERSHLTAYTLPNTVKPQPWMEAFIPTLPLSILSAAIPQLPAKGLREEFEAESA